MVATTGLTETQIAKIRAAAQEIPILWAPSMSPAVNLTMKLTEIAAKASRTATPTWKSSSGTIASEDSPSGTALKFGKIVADAMGNHRAAWPRGRQQTAPRRDRLPCGPPGDNPGEHDPLRHARRTLELTVKATNRDCYAQGALAAAKFLVSKPIGLYGMNDVLGL